MMGQSCCLEERLFYLSAPWESVCFIGLASARLRIDANALLLTLSAARRMVPLELAPVDRSSARPLTFQKHWVDNWTAAAPCRPFSCPKISSQAVAPGRSAWTTPSHQQSQRPSTQALQFPHLPPTHVNRPANIFDECPSLKAVMRNRSQRTSVDHGVSGGLRVRIRTEKAWPHTGIDHC